MHADAETAPPYPLFGLLEAPGRRKARAASMPDASDDDLIRMFRNGDADAFDVLFDRHYASVYAFARSTLSSRDGAEEILQETFLAVARTARTYTPRGRFKAWLMRIVRNRCLNRLASQRRRRAALGEGPLEPADPASPEPPPTRRAEQNETLAAVRAAMQQLPDRQREALALYAFDELTYAEVAEVLQMPAGTVKTLIHRARANLARVLEAPSEESET
jgi:RNA polymerase sigma-70 factor (ECF subfamily)